MLQHHIEGVRHLVEGMRREAAADQLHIEAFMARTQAVLSRLDRMEEALACGNPPPRGTTVRLLGTISGGAA